MRKMIVFAVLADSGRYADYLGVAPAPPALFESQIAYRLRQKYGFVPNIVVLEEFDGTDGWARAKKKWSKINWEISRPFIEDDGTTQGMIDQHRRNYRRMLMKDKQIITGAELVQHHQKKSVLVAAAATHALPVYE